MKDIPINLSELDNPDIYSVATSLLYILKNEPRYSLISELFYILDYKNFIKLIKYYGGQTITIPSSEDILSTMRLLLLYQYSVVEKRDWTEALKAAGFEESETNSARAKLSHFMKLLPTCKFGGRDYK